MIIDNFLNIRNRVYIEFIIIFEQDIYDSMIFDKFTVVIVFDVLQLKWWGYLVFLIKRFKIIRSV